MKKFLVIIFTIVSCISCSEQKPQRETVNQVEKNRTIKFNGFYKSNPIPWVDNHGGNETSGNSYIYLLFRENEEFFRCTLFESDIDFIHFIKNKSREDIENDGSIFNGNYKILDGEITLMYQVANKYNMRLSYHHLDSGNLLDEEDNIYEFVETNYRLYYFLAFILLSCFLYYSIKK